MAAVRRHRFPTPSPKLLLRMLLPRPSLPPDVRRCFESTAAAFTLFLLSLGWRKISRCNDNNSPRYKERSCLMYGHDHRQFCPVLSQRWLFEREGRYGAAPLTFPRFPFVHLSSKTGRRLGGRGQNRIRHLRRFQVLLLSEVHRKLNRPAW